MNILGRRFLIVSLAALLVLPALAPLSATAATPINAIEDSVIVVPIAGKNSPNTGYAVPDHIIVKMKDNTDAAETLPGTFGIASGDVKQTNNVTTVKVPKGKTVKTLVSDLSERSDVEYASPDYVRQVEAYTANPNDTAYLDTTTWSFGGVPYANGKSWWLRSSGANMSTLWGALGAANYGPRATGDDIKVAVIDTGFYMTHPDKGVNIVVGKDEFQSYTNGAYVTDNDVTPASPSAPKNNASTAAHGTAVAGQIAAATNNGVGVAGISYDTTVMVYKVQGIWTTGDPANGYPAGSAVMLDSAIINAIRDAADAGADIINMSLGGPGYSAAMQAAINEAHNTHGVLVCAASGNGGTLNNVNYPAANNNVIAVGSYELNSGGAKVRSGFTDYGMGGDAVAAGANNGQLDVLAPGQGIWGLCDPANAGSGTAGYQWWSGTSMATPAFVGMTALLWRFVPNLTVDEMTGYMLANSVAAGAGQPNTSYGWGYVNPVATYDRLKADFPYLAKPGIVTTKTAYAAENVVLDWSASTGRAVQYRVVRDGIATTQTATTAVYSGLAEGSHTVTVTPVSSYNWYDTGRGAAYTFSVDKTAPVISGIAYASDSITWSDTEGSNPHTTMVRLGIDATQSVAGNAYPIAPGSLIDGRYAFHIVETDAVGNGSSDYSYAFDYVSPLAVPILESAYASHEINPYTITWPADATADYEYVLNGGSVVDVPGGYATLSLVEGPNTFSVRSVKGAVVSGWADSVITYYPPLPAPPETPIISGTSVNRQTFSWAAVPYASSYEYRLNGDAIVAVTGTSASVTGLAEGTNAVELRSRNYSGYSAWSAPGTVIYAPPVPTYALRYSAGTGGTVSGTASQTVSHNGSGTAVTATPATGYHFVSWSDGGTSTTRTDTGVDANLTVSASFAINTYQLAPSAGEHGSISPSSTQTVDWGGSRTFSIAASPGYHVAHVLVDGESVVAVGSYAFTNVTANRTIAVTFEVNPPNAWVLSYLAGTGGSIEGISTQVVVSGENGTAVTAVPAANHHFVSWSDGVLTAKRTDTSVMADKSVTASFAIDTHTITSSAGSGGSISPSGTSQIADGSDSATYTITPSSGHAIGAVKVDGVSRGAIATYKFANVTVNHTISVTFKHVIKLSITSDRTTSTRGHAVVFRGTISPSVSNGTHVTVYIRKSTSSTWTKLSTRHTYSSHHWSYTLSTRTRKHGTYYVQVRYAGDSTRTAATSSSRKVAIK